MRLVWSSMGLLYICSNFMFVNWVLNTWEVQPLPFPTRQYDVAIVLTGVTDNSRTPKDRVYFNRGAERITTPLELYKKGIVKKILITGGTNHFYDNERPSAEALEQFLLDQGVPKTDIIIENEAVNTRENAVFAKQTLLKYPNLKSRLLVTSAFHMKRSKACFGKVGLLCDTYPVSYYGTSNKTTPAKLFVPDAEKLGQFTKIIREMFGYAVYKIMGYA
ncbi:YdcF family protein [Cyclobacteriaceae bacterium]|nr:YdcF family protein [Cyclobacteriaceae bacterium]